MNEYKDKKITKTRSVGHLPSAIIYPYSNGLHICVSMLTNVVLCLPIYVSCGCLGFVVVRFDTCFLILSPLFLLFVVSCSFLDDAFRKNLESALRFGNPLFVQVRWSDHVEGVGR